MAAPGVDKTRERSSGRGPDTCRSPTKRSTPWWSSTIDENRAHHAILCSTVLPTWTDFVWVYIIVDQSHVMNFHSLWTFDSSNQHSFTMNVWIISSLPRRHHHHWFSPLLDFLRPFWKSDFWTCIVRPDSKTLKSSSNWNDLPSAVPEHSTNII